MKLVHNIPYIFRVVHLYVTNNARKKYVFDQIKKTKNPPQTNLDMYLIWILSAMATSLSYNLQDFNGTI